jgi:hypothetical protein
MWPLCAVISAVVISITWFLVSRYVGELRVEADELLCGDRLARIGVAVRHYFEDHNRFPPLYLTDSNGRRLHSWRVLLLPYLGCEEYHSRIDLAEPWNSDKNTRVAREAPWFVRDLYKCPLKTTCSSHDAGFVAIVYADGREDGGELRVFEERSRHPVIVVTGISNSGIHWMEPRDLSLDKVLTGQVSLTAEDRVITVLTSDGDVGRLSRTRIAFHGSENDLLQRWLGGRAKAEVLH